MSEQKCAVCGKPFMDKAVTISIRPKSCELIANGKKTVEVRKTRPKIKPPFKCYIYCTKDKHGWFDFLRKTRLDGKVIGEFVCDRIDFHSISGLIVKEDAEKTLRGTCITKNEMLDYLKYERGTCIYSKPYDFYGWHISSLVIYDTPRELGKFRKPCDKDYDCFLCDKSGYAPDMQIACFNTLTRPPQSWCYVLRNWRATHESI